MGDQPSDPQPWTRSEFVVAGVITMVALGFALAHLASPTVKVDSTTVGLAVIAVLPWLAKLLARYVKSFKAPGGWEVDFQGLQRQVTEVEGAVQSASQKANLANAALAAPVTSSANAPAGAPAEAGAAGTAPAATSPNVTLQRLAADYNQIRATQKAGSTRTAAMTAVFRQLLTVVPTVPGFDVRQALRSADDGERLAAYALLYAQPQPALLDALVQAVCATDPTPFGQYWGLQAVERVLASLPPSAVSTDTLGQLRRFYRKLRPGTDRHYELGQILQPFGPT